MLRCGQRLPRISLSSIRNAHSVTLDVGDTDPIVLTTGHMARFASGAVVASQGDNAVLATCVYNKSDNGSQGFVPLTVDFRQSAAAIGKIPTTYLRRELSQSDADIISSRIVDRTLRPLFPPGWSNETQIVCKPLSLQEHSDPVLLAVNASASALHISQIPFDGPVAAVRMRLVDDKVIINPSSESGSSDLDMVLAGCADQRTVMIEMDGNQINPSRMEEILWEGLNAVDKMLISMNNLRSECGKDKVKFSPNTTSQALSRDVERLAKEKLYYIFTDSTLDKIARDNQIKDVGSDIFKSLSNSKFPITFEAFVSVYSDVTKKILRQLVLDTSMRCDGRSLTDFRPITINVDVYKKLHGSALFQRGQTQVLSTVTFDSPSAAFHPDSISQMLGAQRKKMFMLHYEFPSFATNEISKSRGVNRREVGHGALAEKALKHVVPTDFPFSIRLASQVLESNGSSSMATVCGGSLALLDAGVPLKASAAGVAIGLITGENKDNDYKILTDILGIEDYAGDMDFKIAGTNNGFTAMQLDVKIGGLTKKQLSEALKSGHNGVQYVLSKMAEHREQPREQFKSTVPVIETVRIEPHKRQAIFRNGGYNSKQIEAETGVKVTPEDEYSVSLFSPNATQMAIAKQMMEKLVSENDTVDYEFGKIIEVELIELLEKGVQVRLPNSSRLVYMPNSRLANIPVKHSSAIGLKVNQKIKVQWLGRDPQSGQIRLSRRTLT